jgi:hypothetical protein
MYCNHCGAPMAVDQAVCTACGKSTVETRVAYAARSRVAGHVHLLAVLWMVHGVFWAIATVVMFVIAAVTAGIATGTLPPHRPGPGDAVAPVLFIVLGVSFAGVTIANFIAGLGLLRLRPWARTMALVMAFIALLNMPFGTALGIYTLFVLLPTAAADQYDIMSRNAALYSPAAARTQAPS